MMYPSPYFVKLDSYQPRQSAARSVLVAQHKRYTKLVAAGKTSAGFCQQLLEEILTLARFVEESERSVMALLSESRDEHLRLQTHLAKKTVFDAVHRNLTYLGETNNVAEFTSRYEELRREIGDDVYGIELHEEERKYTENPFGL